MNIRGIFRPRATLSEPESARKAAGESGLTEEAAVAQVAQGALAAAAAISPEATARVKDALPADIFAASFENAEKGRSQKEPDTEREVSP